MKKLSKNINRVFLTLMLSLLSILVFLLLILFIFWNIALKNYTKQVICMEESKLEQLETEYINILNICNRITNDLTLDFNIYKLAKKKDLLKGNDLWETYNTVQDVMNYTINIDCIHNCYVYLKNSNVVLSNGYYAKKYNYAHNTLNLGLSDYEKWNSLSKVYDKDKLILYQMSNKLIYQKPYNIQTENYGTIQFLLNTKELQGIAAKTLDLNSGCVILKCDDGQIMFGNSDAFKAYNNNKDINIINDNLMINKYNILSTHLVRQIELIYIVQEDYLMNQIKPFKILIIISSIVLSTFCILLIYIISKTHSLKLQKIFMNLNEEQDSDKMGAYEALSWSIKSIQLKNEFVMNELIKQKEKQKNQFLYNVLQGYYLNEKELDEELKHYSSIEKRDYYSVITVATNQYEGKLTYNKVKVIINSFFDLKYRSIFVELCDKEEDSLFIIVGLNGNFNKVTKTINQIANDLYEHLIKKEIPEYLSISSLHNKFYYLKSCYMEIQQIKASQIIKKKQGVIYLQQYNKEERVTGYYFTDAMRKRLCHTILSGNEQEVLNYLKMIIQQNILDRQISSEYLHMLVQEICIDLFHIVQNITDHQVQQLFMEELRKNKLKDDLYQLQMCIDYSKKITKYFNNKKIEADDIFINICQYINNNFCNNDFCMNDICKEFNYSEAYIFNVFKAKGQSYYKFLEKKRMEKACELLRNTNNKIKLIAEKSGYNSSNTFCRVFKKTYGVSATQFRTQFVVNNKV